MTFTLSSPIDDSSSCSFYLLTLLELKVWPTTSSHKLSLFFRDLLLIDFRAIVCLRLCVRWVESLFNRALFLLHSFPCWPESNVFWFFFRLMRLWFKDWVCVCVCIDDTKMTSVALFTFNLINRSFFLFFLFHFFSVFSMLFIYDRANAKVVIITLLKWFHNFIIEKKNNNNNPATVRI